MLSDTFSSWIEDNTLRLSAALAYYTIFALAPLLVIAIGIAGVVFGQEAARGHIVAQIRGLVGEQNAQAIQIIIENAGKSGGGPFATAIGIGALAIGATGIFGQLQDALNTIWDVRPRPGRGIIGIIHDRIFSFLLVLGLGFLLLVSLVASTVLATLNDHFETLLRNYALLQTANSFISFLAITFVFAVVFKIVPDIDIPWRDACIGAIATSLLFNIGRFLVSLYLGYSSIASVYGVAGSLMVLLLWIFYSANILLFGAEFTRAYADAMGSRVVPKRGAVRIVLEHKSPNRTQKLPSFFGEDHRENVKDEKCNTASKGIQDSVLSRIFYPYNLWRRKKQ